MEWTEYITKTISVHQIFKIHLQNIKEFETISYSLARIIGTVIPKPLSPTLVKLKNITRTSTIQVPVVNGAFKAYVILKPGENHLEFHIEERQVLKLRLNYEIPTRDQFVRVVYIKCRDHDGSFQAPEWEDASLESAKRRIILGTQLLQMFIAEALYNKNHGRRTIHIECDGHGVPLCHVHETQLSLCETHTITDSIVFFRHLAKELVR